MNDIELTEIRMFVHVVRAGSFALAAQRLSIPANTLSRRIRQLESRVKTRLLQRSTRRLGLTAAGQSFFDRCAPAVDDLQRAAQDLADGGRGPHGLVRVAAPAGFLELFRIDWIAEFLSLYPQVTLDMVLDDARVDLIAGGIDAAFRAGRIDETGVAILCPLLPQRLGLFAGPAYLAGRAPPRDLDDLVQHDCLIVSNRAGRAVWELRGPDGVEQVAVTGRFCANNVQILQRAAIAGLGIALLPVIITGADVEAGRLRRVLPGYRRDGENLNVVVPSLERIPPAVTAFVEFAVSQIRASLAPKA
ncbi:MAG: LysR family transcriptional regulator [Gammaproteobacteria bacterium]|nr:LysR family transcriptional regulator [Gammaproteobacteria bacterium]